MMTMDTRTTMGMGTVTTGKMTTITLNPATTQNPKRKVVPTADDSSPR
jgi:hypothetical protein